MYNSVDIICAAILLVLGVLGYHTGAIASIFYLASGFVGVFLAQKFAANLHVNFIVFFTVITLCLIAFGMLSRAMARFFLLGFADRLAGFVIGVILGALMLAMAVEPASEKFSNSVKNKIHVSYTATRVVPSIFSRVRGLKDLRAICK